MRKKLKLLCIALSFILAMEVVFFAGWHLSRRSLEASRPSSGGEGHTEEGAEPAGGSEEADDKMPTPIPLGPTQEDDQADPTPEAETEDTEAPFEDYAMDWKDPVLEAKMREITGIETGDIMFSDVHGLTELDLSGEYYLPDARRIHDISALGVLTELTSIKLDNSAVTDLSPLRTLP